MILDSQNNNNDNNHTSWTLSSLYEYVKNNIRSIIKDPEINEMIDPKNNITTKKYLEENDNEDEAFASSYFFTLILIMNMYDIELSDA